MTNLTPHQRETLEELNRRAKRLAREARPAYRLKQERWVIVRRILWLCLLMIGIFTTLVYLYIC
jgi:hypothetical protein